jgi:hypothetical protein
MMEMRRAWAANMRLLLMPNAAAVHQKLPNEYIVLRNPWGRAEFIGLNTYQCLLSLFDDSFWRPANMIGNDGIFALETSTFEHDFAYFGIAKQSSGFRVLWK